MKNKFLSIIASAAVAGSALVATSCADNLDLTNPDGYDAGNFWQSEANFTGNLVAMMNQWRGFDGNTLFYLGEFRTDYYWTIGGTDGSGLRNTFWPENAIDYTTPGITNFGGYYGLISNCNTFLYYDELRGDVMSQECRDYLLGMIYGMRAYCFFQIHKLYGSGPLRIKPDVLLGNYDEVALQMARCTAEEMLTQIKSDINESLAHFNAAGNYSNSLFTGNRGANFWRKVTTEMLAGEVYLWSGKVSTLDHKANPADVATAKTYFNNVLNNYGLSLMPTFNEALNGNKANNTEMIFSTYYSETETTTNWFNYIMYDVTTGGSPNNFWSCVEKDGTTWSTTANRLTYWYDPTSKTKERNQFYNQRMNGQQHQAVRNAYWYQFDQEDSRIKTLMPLYLIKNSEKGLDENGKPIEGAKALEYIPNFDFDDHILAGCYVWKYHGSLGVGGKMIGTNDMPYYRLAQVYLNLAEIANYEGNNNDVVKYINAIRKRAYGDNWDETKYGYTAGSFLENEVAILQESAKEFFQEGKRWWDLRRMTAVKGGTDKDHLIFRPEGCLGYGLDLAAHPNWYEITPNYDMLGRYTIETDVPVLDYATQKHLVLYPLDKNLLDGDKLLKQNPGYGAPKGQEGGAWIEN